jgi:membrane protein DedA with SNARE-associated domain
MWEILIKYASVFGLSMLKFILGPVTSVSLGLSVIEGYILTVSGMMLTVAIITILGPKFRKKILERFYPNRKMFTNRNRQIVVLWRKYGLWSIALLTPLLLSPPLGTFIAVALGEGKRKILIYMFISALFWGLILSLLGSQVKEVYDNYL